ncbi:hypothetical protein [Fretibacter rubidus]|uniref:hypothetical protein n=1 Tax=Fretibacter rubidus TaxID=570162 RepID=UPI003529EB62
MTYKLYAPFALCITLGLSACGSDSSQSTNTDSVTELRVTAEVNTNVNAAHITVIPNDVAPWLSHIILIDQDGDLYQTALDSGVAKPLNMKAVDAVGLMREQAAGVVLTLSEAGTISALIESDDEGNLSPLPVSSSVGGLSRFCETAHAPSGTVFAQAEGGDVVEMGVLVQESQIILSEIERSKGQADAACYVNGDTVSFQQSSDGRFAVLDFGDRTILSAADKGAVWSGGGAVTITSGLSTPGIDTARAVHATSDSLGGAFRDGAIIMADADAPRLVMISAGFARSVLDPIDESATPDP